MNKMQLVYWSDIMFPTLIRINERKKMPTKKTSLQTG